MTIAPVNNVDTDLNTIAVEAPNRNVPLWTTKKRVAVFTLNLLLSPVWSGVYQVAAVWLLYREMKGEPVDPREGAFRFRMRFCLKGMIPIYNAFVTTALQEQRDRIDRANGVAR